MVTRISKAKLNNLQEANALLQEYYRKHKAKQEQEQAEKQAEESSKSAEEEESNDVAKVFLGRPTRSRRFNEVEVEDNFMAISGIIPEDSPYHVPALLCRESSLRRYVW